MLCALNAAGVAGGRSGGAARGGVAASVQRDDGGWGEDEESYARRPTRPLQGEHAEPDGVGGARADGGGRGGASCRRARHRLPDRDAGARTAGGRELPYTAVGFPRVFYLRYHGYRWYFPLLALARYRNLRRGNTRRVAYGF